MRALALKHRAKPNELADALSIVDLPLPEPGPDEIRVKVEASGLNPTDYQRAEYGIAEWEWPAVLGLDVVGIVDAIGSGVVNVREGQRVAYVGDIRRRGGFAEYALSEADVLALVPDSVDPIAAGALPSAGLTAFQAVHRRLHVGPGDIVLVTGGAGGVGGFAVQLAALAGARVIATEAGDNAEYVRSLGADAVVDFRTEDIVARVRELTNGRGVDAVVDTIGAESATANLGLLAHNGGLASIAGRPDLGVVPPFSVAPSLHEIALGAAYMIGDERSRGDLSVMLTELLDMVAAGRVNSMVARTVTLEEVPGALVQLSTRQVRGKLVLAW